MGAIFHLSPVLLAQGSVILPGNFGRILKLKGESHKLWTREYTLEKIKQTEFADKPSRFQATFCCSTFEIAELYRDSQKSTDIIYEVEYIEETNPIHVGDYNCVEPLPGRAESMEEIARLYWANKLKTNLAHKPNTLCQELVCASAIKVINQCT